MVVALKLANTESLRFAVQAGDVSTPAADFFSLYFKAGGLYWIDENDVVSSLIVADPQTLTFNSIQPTTGDYTPLTLRGYGTTPAVDLFVVKEGATGTTKFVIDDDGQVGIGQASPSEELDVVGTIETFYSTTSRAGEAIDTYSYWEPVTAAGGSLRTIYSRAEYDSAEANTTGQLSTYFGLAWVTSAGIADIENVLLRSENQAAGTCVNFSDIYIQTAVNSGGGAITNYNGLYIEDQTVATNNYAIRTNAGFVVLNEGGHAESDIRVETDNEDHFLYIDTGADWMRIGDWDTNYVEIDNGGDMHFVGGAGFPFGHCYGNEIAWSQAAAAQNTWYDISDADMVSGNLHNVTHDGNGQLTALVAGMYNADWAGSFEADATGVHVQVTFSVNGTEDVSGTNHYETTATNKQQTMSGVSILDLAANDTVNVSIRTTDAGAPDLLIDHLLLRINHVGGT